VTAQAAAATAINHDGCLAAFAVGRRRRMACRCCSPAGCALVWGGGRAYYCCCCCCCCNCLRASCCWMTMSRHREPLRSPKKCLCVLKEADNGKGISHFAGLSDFDQQPPCMMAVCPTPRVLNDGCAAAAVDESSGYDTWPLPLLGYVSLIAKAIHPLSLFGSLFSFFFSRVVLIR